MCNKERNCLQTNTSDKQSTYYIFALAIIAGISWQQDRRNHRANGAASQGKRQLESPLEP